MYPPAAVLKIAQRYPILREIKPGERSFIKGLTVLWAILLPLLISRLMLGFSWERMMDNSLSISVWVAFFCGQLMLLVREDRPLLAAWLAVFAFVALVIVCILGVFLAYSWFGIPGVPGVILFIVLCVVFDEYRRRKSGERARQDRET